MQNEGHLSVMQVAAIHTRDTMCHEEFCITACHRMNSAARHDHRAEEEQSKHGIHTVAETQHRTAIFPPSEGADNVIVFVGQVRGGGREKRKGR